MGEGIRIIQGPTGAGKGLMAIQWIWEQLSESERCVVTNFGLKVGELNAWIQKHHPEKNIDLGERLLCLDDEQVKEWWCWFGPGRRIPGVTVEYEKRTGDFCNFKLAAGWKAAWLIDEADIHMAAREFGRLPRSAILLGKMHRHSGHAMAFCVQSLEQLDKQWRLLAAETFTMKNCSVQRLGWFRGPAMFSWSRYYRTPRGGEPPSVSGHFSIASLDGLADCYETHSGAAGVVGIPGAKEGTKKSGLPLWTLVLFAAAIIGLLVGGLWALGWGVRRGVSTLAGAGPSQETISATLATAPERVARAMGHTNAIPPRPEFVSSPPVQAPHVVGFVHLSGRPRVCLSDGNKWFVLGDGHFTAYGSRWVEIDRVRYDRP